MKDELVRAIRTNTPQSPLANISYAAKVNQLTLLGNIVMLCGGEVLWDKKLGLTNRPEVNDLLRKSYRDGWKVAEI